MRITQNPVSASGIRLSVSNDGVEVARAYLYIMHNDLHQEPFGLLEDVFVREEVRNHGLGTRLVIEAIEVARERKCYKLIATSRYERPKVHELYPRLGFKQHGVEFRLDF